MMILAWRLSSLSRKAINAYGIRFTSYIQGQSSEKYLREYFYFIDHQGMLFLDDARMKNFTSCFKEVKFLRFFFRQIRRNETDRYRDEFPWVSPCGKEMNYVRCDDTPLVYTHLGEDEEILYYNHGVPLLSAKFEPSTLCMLPENGRVYHAAPARYGSVGLVRSKLAIKLSSHFDFDDKGRAVAFKWKGSVHRLQDNTRQALLEIPHYIGHDA